jgi:peptidoglycan/LPS O-acetylase OafA/YrhL
MWIIILLLLLVAALTGTLGQVLEIAAGVVVGLVLFAVGIGLAAYYYVRHLLRRALRDPEHWAEMRDPGDAEARGTRGPPRPLPPPSGDPGPP